MEVFQKGWLDGGSRVVQHDAHVSCMLIDVICLMRVGSKGSFVGEGRMFLPLPWPLWSPLPCQRRQASYSPSFLAVQSSKGAHYYKRCGNCNTGPEGSRSPRVTDQCCAGILSVALLVERATCAIGQAVLGGWFLRLRAQSQGKEEDGGAKGGGGQREKGVVRRL